MEKIKKSLGLLAVAALIGAALPVNPAAYAAPKKDAQAEAQPAPIVNVNKATAEELQTLRGVGPAIAGRIIQYRQEHGSFQKAEDLRNIHGIGAAKFEKLKNQVTV